MLSLRLRLNLAALLVLLVFIALTALALEKAFRDSALASMQERLQAQLYLLMAATEVSPEGVLLVPRQLAEARLNLPDSGLYARINDATGQALWHSSSAIQASNREFALLAQEQHNRQGFVRDAESEATLFIAALRVDWEQADGSLPLIFSIAEDARPFETQLRGYRQNLFAWLGAMAVLLLLALSAALTWGLRPLQQVSTEIRAIEAGQQADLRGNYPSEIRQLSDNLNALLHHERAQQARYQHALGDLAHSLKTPLAVLRTLPERTPVLDEQIARMDHIVQYQLQRAATAGRSALATPISLQGSLDRLLRSLHKVYAERGIRVQQMVDPRCRFRGDEGDLLELLGNLLDNAFKWTAQRIRIEAWLEDGQLLIAIEDDGPGIAPEQIEPVMQRGTRLDEATPGHGIGMAMVRDIVAAYQGQLSIARSEWGGALIRVTLPG
ncbi:MAG: GHKL domain-containing protein [Chromatiales bacterium]|nr:GHKL domain-containing protein [Gammaproteobacteria bacterium]MBW6477016.1 GHKL domain-containing protein [Chromatiales bacterium]